jgi:serpin B
MRVLLVVALLSSFGCKSKASEVVPASAQEASKPQEEEPQTPIEILPLEKGLNSFALNLYKETPKKGNMVVSPFSVAAALSLLELGSEGKSAMALHRLLHSPGSVEYREGLHALLEQLKGSEKPPEETAEDLNVPSETGWGVIGEPTIHPHTLKIRNSLWGANSFPLRPEFTASAATLYSAKVASMDVSKPEESAAKINAWVAEATDNKIANIIAPRSIHSLTRLIVVNAVYFVGRWHWPFLERNTADLDFYPNGDDTPVRVRTMKQGQFFRFTQDEAATVVEMPYWSTSDKTEMAMLLILPKKRDGLEQLEKSLSLKLLESWIDALKTEKSIDLYLPRWKAESDAMLQETLSAMGIGRLFSDQANLGGISPEPGLSIDGLMHRAVINVDEKGTEAAAATSMMTIGAGAPPVPVEVHMDHPFLYLIRDTKTGVILFVGRVVDPR